MVFLTNEGASSSSSTCRWKYDVFLSFKGEDTRTGFTTYLYEALKQKGINTFMDDKLPRGEEISVELLKTIEESMILVIVFSKNYAESKWCLDELVKIVECRENDEMVLLRPIFYNVEPREVRNQLGNFGIALANHEKNFKDNMGKMPRWKEVLSKAASVSGWHYEEGCTAYKSEYDFIQGIVKEISSAKFNRIPLYDAKYLVGINSRVKDIKPLLNIKLNEVRILGIHGLPGVGKTTIAKVVYCIIAHQFEGSCFLEKVREKSINCGMIQLQEKLLSKILQDNNLKVDSEFGGTNLIKGRTCCKKVLLVLDDVDNSEQIEKLLGKCDWFASGSIVIITTRDKQVLSTLPEGRRIYKVEGLDPCEAQDLFNMHAFHTNEPKEDYSKLAKLIISYAKGLPLALKVMGSTLCGKSIREWRSAFEMYKNIQHEKIQEILKISFIGLNKKEKDIFLDIACFFKGFNKDYVVKILDACDLYPDFGIGRLIDKCLITVDYCGALQMHDLVQQMGRDIVQEESEELENRSRIWCHEDANKLLTGNKGSNKIRGIMWCEPKPITVSLNASAFKKMENLKFLIVENVQNSEELTYLSNELRLFEWSGYNFSLPSKFCPQKLVGLKVSSSRISLFEQRCHYKYLMSIKLERCQSITRVPDLCAPNLETLNISFCENLIEIDDSIGLLDKLEYWDLKGCSNLQILPSTLKLNKEFCLSGCPRIEKFPNVHPETKCIYVSVDGSNIREWPSSLKYITKGATELMLVEKDTSIVNSFDCFSESQLSFEDGELQWSGGIIIDFDFWIKNDFFPALRFMRIDNSNIVSIPECISRLSRLEEIYLSNCKQLREIPRLPQSIRQVEITKCPSLLLQSSSRLLDQRCHYKYLKSIKLEMCQSITRVPDLCAPNLETLNISFCENLIEIDDSIGLLDKLEYWYLEGCTNLQILPSTLKLNKEFCLYGCPRIEKFPNVHPEAKCTYVNVFGSNIREWPSSLKYITKWTTELVLEEEDTSTVNSFGFFGNGKLRWRGGIKIDLDFCIKNDFFPALRFITIDNYNIVSIPECISRLSRLKEVYLSNCKRLREIPRLPQSIRQVEITKCPSLLPQSSSRLLNQFGKILGILPNRVREGARSGILMDLSDDSKSESDSDIEGNLFLPGTEIPKSLKFNHQSFGNSISFKVGCKFPKLVVCVAFRSAEAHIYRRFEVHVSINGCKRRFNDRVIGESYEEMWLFSRSLWCFPKPNLSEQNQVEVEVICKIDDRYSCGNPFELVNHTDFIKWFGVNVECICCPQKSDITYLPLPSDRNDCGSSSILNDTELPPFQLVFPTSYGSGMDCRAFSNEGDLGNSMEPTNIGFEPGLKGFLGDLNVSLSAPNNSELLALLPGPNMDHEVSNTVNDLRLLKGIYNDGCDLSLSRNDSNERESEPPLFPDLTNGFDFGFAQPNLELGSGVSSGFHLGSSSMAHASANDDSDFNMGSSSMAHDCVNADSDFNMGPPPKKARTS